MMPRVEIPVQGILLQDLSELFYSTSETGLTPVLDAAQIKAQRDLEKRIIPTAFRSDSLAISLSMVS